MKRTMVYLLLSVLLCVSSAAAEDFFPIGAWFPFSQDSAGVNRYNNLSQTQVDTILQQVKNCGFNVVHAPLHEGAYQTTTLNAKLLNGAQAQGLKVQLYAWQHPAGGDSVWHKGKYWCRTADMTAYNTDVQNSLVLRGSYTVKGITYRFETHRFYLKTDDNTTADTVAVIEVWDGGELKASDSIIGTSFDFPDSNQSFPLTYYVNSTTTVTYKVQYTGAANLWVDKVRAYGISEYEWAYKLLDGKYDTRFGDIVDSYNSYPAMWRFYLADEPWWDVTNESIRYMGDFLQARGKSWQACNHYIAYPTWLNKFVEETQPPELLINPFPFGPPGPPLQSELNNLATWLQNGKNAANLPSPSIPLWVVVQVHEWWYKDKYGVWHMAQRDPTPEEIRVQVNIALAYGAKGSHIDELSGGNSFLRLVRR